MARAKPGADVAVFAGKGKGIVARRADTSTVSEADMLDALYEESVKFAARVERRRSDAYERIRRNQAPRADRSARQRLRQDQIRRAEPARRQDVKTITAKRLKHYAVPFARAGQKYHSVVIVMNYTDPMGIWLPALLEIRYRSLTAKPDYHPPGRRVELSRADVANGGFAGFQSAGARFTAPPSAVSPQFAFHRHV